MELKQRMYGFVPYNISEIQKGIQFGHAVVEYMTKYRDYPDLTKWAEEDKVFIILNGGTTNIRRDLEGISFGSLNQIQDLLQKQNIRHATFVEEDLGDQLTSVVFLVDEKVWDKKKYPDFKFIFDSEDIVENFKDEKIDSNNFGEVLEFLEFHEEHKQMKIYTDWAENYIGMDNVWLRYFLKDKRLA